MSALYESCGGCGAETPSERCIGCLHDFGSGQTAPSNSNTSGLSDACAQEEADTLSSKLTNAEIITASWKDRATAAEARADRLADIVRRCVAALDASRSGGEYPDFEEWEKDARAALQQETQP